MDRYEELVSLADKLGLEVIEKEFKSSAKGLCKGNKIGISKAIATEAEKRCILAEEMAHSYYTVGDILDTRSMDAMRQERIARAIAFENLLPLYKLVDAYLNCCHDYNDIPDYLGVTWEFLDNTLDHYCRKYGGLTRHGKYIIYFSPLIVCERSNIKAV